MIKKLKEFLTSYSMITVYYVIALGALIPAIDGTGRYGQLDISRINGIALALSLFFIIKLIKHARKDKDK